MIHRPSSMFYLFFAAVLSFDVVVTTPARQERASASPQLLGRFRVPNPGFTSLYQRQEHGKTTYDLYVSSFSGIPLSSDHVYVVRDVGSTLTHVSGIRPVHLTNQVTWPNEISIVPDDVFNTKMIVVADGFLVPTKTRGSIKLLDVSGSTVKGPYDITGGRGSWFYHRVIWQDMDKDGDKDAVTCRANKPVIGATKGELLWFENPASHDFHHPWTEHVIAQGPDVYFRYETLNTPSGTFDAIFTAGFFSKELSVYWTTNGKWTDMSQVHSHVIDNSVGSIFEVEVVDLNKDGNLDLLVSVNDPRKGSVYAYEIPNDFRSDKYPRHLLATNFRAKGFMVGKGAPGSSVTLDIPGSQKKPPILVSGDDDGKAYILTPNSEAHNDWSYTLTDFDHPGSTVGELSYADVNGDGSIEIFVPEYGADHVAIYSYRPS